MKITEDKYIEILEIQGISYNKNSKWFTVSLERINKAIDYSRCSLELTETLCRLNSNFKCNCTDGVNCNNFDKE